MFAFAVRRLLVSIPVFLLSTFFVFILVAYGADPLGQLRAKNPPPSQAVLNAMANTLYLNRGLVPRYWHWLTQLILHGNWGPSINSGTDIGQLLGSSLTLTMRLVILAMIVAVFFAILAGVVSAVRQYSKVDYTITLIGFLFLSLPVFWFAILLKQLAINFNNSTGTYFLQTYGANTPGETGWSAFSDAIGHIILPTIVLAMTSYASWSRFQRASMLDVLGSDYMRLARAKGLSRRRVMIRHGLRTALIPLTTQVALDVAAILGGAVLTENVFGWQGMGTMLISGIEAQDTNVILAWLVVSAIIVILFNLIADLLYAVLDPRIRLG
ncbi:MAG TPA: ABC transporter permease [Actinocrinis sp.]|uniref:ABC transporter permease n=1 Tax=Actinocrinis sp. TaxID=1920516 RepID=UPI002DDCED7A|nr:ABC transporter permease [Actinocrinis sp.]HEV3168929.1 ABC transporter permease [Actinocrinis sp.]